MGAGGTGVEPQATGSPPPAAAPPGCQWGAL